MTTEGGQGEGNTLQGILGEDDEDEDEVLEEDNGWGQEEEEEEEEEEEKEQQHPFQEDHVDVTNWLNLLDRSMTPPSPVNPSDTLFG